MGPKKPITKKTNGKPHHPVTKVAGGKRKSPPPRIESPKTPIKRPGGPDNIGPDFVGQYSIYGKSGPVNEKVSAVRDIIAQPAGIGAPYLKKGGKTKTTKMKKGGSTEDKKWIQKAINPKHKGYCTPMTKPTCTPKRKALAKTLKAMAKKK